jgi:hypothetical protein
VSSPGQKGVGLVFLTDRLRSVGQLCPVGLDTEFHHGRTIALSTPAGKRGWFYLEWAAGVGWERTRTTANDCPRVSAEFLEYERRLLGEHVFYQEYEYEFYDPDSAVFSSEMIDAPMTDDVEPFWEDVAA